jgi:hypothetical protein
VRLITALIGEQDLNKFFTLTLDPGMIDTACDPWDYIHDVWSRFRKRMNRRYDNFVFVAVLESHKNSKLPHIHGFTNVWMKQAEWSDIWLECGGGKMTWVSQVDKEEIADYVSKELEVAKYVGKENLLEGYKQRGSHRSLWRSKKLKAKFELTSSEKYVMIKEIVFDEQGQMTDFFAKKGIWSDGKKERKRKDLETTRSTFSEQSTETGECFMDSEEQEDEQEES